MIAGLDKSPLPQPIQHQPEEYNPQQSYPERHQHHFKVRYDYHLFPLVRKHPASLEMSGRDAVKLLFVNIAEEVMEPLDRSGGRMAVCLGGAVNSIPAESGLFDNAYTVNVGLLQLA